MRTMNLITALAFGLMTCMGYTAVAQTKPAPKTTTAKPAAKPAVKPKPKAPAVPSWAQGFKERYIYFPDHFAYYDTKKRVFHCFKSGKWNTSPQKSGQLEYADLHKVRKVGLADNSDTPYYNNQQHKNRWPKK